MIDYETANLRDLSEELVKTRDYLSGQREEIAAIYESMRTSLEPKNLNILTHYYESDLLSRVFVDSDSIIKIIENIIADENIRDIYVSKLEEIALNERRQYIAEFKTHWLNEVGDNTYSDLYIAIDHLNQWLDDSVNIARGLKEFIGERNLLTSNTSTSEKFWITKDNNGDYLFDGKHVHFKKTDTNYVKIFDSVFSLRPMGGEVNYRDIIEACRARGITVNNKSIQRALTGAQANFFYYVKDVGRELPYGIPLFHASQVGDILTFNNKKR